MAHGPGNPTPPVGLLLTGGSSRRMGFAKGTLTHSHAPLSRTLGELLGSVTDPAVEVGPGYSRLPTVEEASPGRGPTSAIVAGWEACRMAGGSGPVIVLACDLPFVTRPLLAWLVSRPGGGSVVPVVDGLAQPLCARWSVDDVDRMRDLVARGDRSFRSLCASGSVTLVDERSWGAVAETRAFVDVDTPDDLERFGLEGGAGVVAASPPPDGEPSVVVRPFPGRGPSPG